MLAKDVEVLGHIDEVPTSSGFIIKPYIGIIPFPYKLHISISEVDAILEMPLRCLFSDAFKRDEVTLKNNKALKFPTYVYRNIVVFGATARILDDFAMLIDAS